MSLGDINGNGSPEVSVLMQMTTGKNYAYVIDASDGSQLAKVKFNSTLTPISQVVVDNFADISPDYTTAPEVAMLGVDSSGYVKVHLKDASSGSAIKILGFGPGFSP